MRTPPRSTDAPAPTRHPIARRAFLGVVGVGASSILWGDAASSFLSRGLHGVTSLLPAGVRAALPAPDSGWRIYSVKPPLPSFDPASWRLRIEGLVERPHELTDQELLALPRAQKTSDFHCVTGWSVPVFAGRGFASPICSRPRGRCPTPAR
jgi:hypothetical protein